MFEYVKAMKLSNGTACDAYSCAASFSGEKNMNSVIIMMDTVIMAVSIFVIEIICVNVDIICSVLWVILSVIPAAILNINKWKAKGQIDLPKKRSLAMP